MKTISLEATTNEEWTQYASQISENLSASSL